MKSITKAASVALLFVGMGSLLLAVPANGIPGLPCPEIDAASAGNAMALLGGAVLMIRSRKK